MFSPECSCAATQRASPAVPYEFLAFTVRWDRAAEVLAAWARAIFPAALEPAGFALTPRAT